MATLGLVALPSQIVPMDDMITSIILLIGLAVGVDYTLFYLRREREEKARGAGKLEAVHTAAATSGRAVLVSGFTVMAAMAGMLLAGDRTFTSLGIGAIMVVAVAMIGSLTVVPAMLAWLGDRVDKGRIPFLQPPAPRRRREPRRGARPRPRPAAPGRLGRASAAACWSRSRIPAFSMHTAQHGHRRPAAQARGHAGLRPHAGRLPRRRRSRRSSPSRRRRDVARRSPPRSSDLEAKAVATGTMNAPVDVDVSPDKHVALVNVPIAGRRHRRRVEPALSRRCAAGSSPARSAARRASTAPTSTGMAAAVQGLQRPDEGARAARVRVRPDAGVPAAAGDVPLDRHPDQGDRAEPAVGGRRLRRPRRGSSRTATSRTLLGFKSNGGVTSWLPMFLFVILFGLSMDYHVFILSRIREAVDRGMSDRGRGVARHQGDRRRRSRAPRS